MNSPSAKRDLDGEITKAEIKDVENVKEVENDKEIVNDKEIRNNKEVVSNSQDDNDSEDEFIVNEADRNEVLLKNNPRRFTTMPIQHEDIWRMAKAAEASIWHAKEVNLLKDLQDFQKLDENQKHFIKYVLAFFASSDGIVNENLGSRFFREVQFPEARHFYGVQIMMENIHCVAPDTMVLTNQGYYPIGQLANQEVYVWNGDEFSRTCVRLTSKEPKKLLTVHLSNGAMLNVTEDHKWYIQPNKNAEESHKDVRNAMMRVSDEDTEKEDKNTTHTEKKDKIADSDDEKGAELAAALKIETKDLVPGHIIAEYSFPIVVTGRSMFGAYEVGAKFAASKINKLESGVRNRYDNIPLNVAIDDRLKWLAGYLDIIMINSINEQSDSWIIVDELPVLRRLQLLFQTFGLKVNISESNAQHDESNIQSDITNKTAKSGFHIRLYASDIIELKKLGFTTKIYQFNVAHKAEKPTSKLYVVRVEDNNIRSETYCFNDPNKHKGVFNGVLTGQSEVYSQMIDTYIEDPDERETLFDAIHKVPCIRKKAKWAMKWITKSDSFATRLVAMACVEGIFFSGSFCAIYWLNEQNLMKSLAKANDFIARDEGSHTDFACKLYVSYITNKLSQQTIYEIVCDAVNIEMEFITEALPCKLLGINADSMKQYIKYVANRLVIQLGYDPPFEKGNIKQPFPFMDRIALKNKSNFFEDDPSEYSKDVVKKDEDDPYADI